MSNLKEALHAIQSDTLEVAIWQVLAILAAATICILIRGSKMGLLVTYAFTVNIAFNFFQQFFSKSTMLIAGIFAGLILLIGLYETFTER